MTGILQQAQNKLRTGLFIFGLVTLLAGIAILVWPGKTAVIVTGIFAVYTIIAGVVYFAAGIFSAGMGFGARIWRLVLGALFVVAGVVAFSNLAAFSAAFFVMMAVLIGITWIYEGVLTFMNLGAAGSKGWAIAFGIMSVAAGLIIVVSSFGSLGGAVGAASMLWWAIGVAGVIYGIAEMISAIVMGD